MARLEEKMKRVSAGAAEQLPDDALRVMEGHTRQLQASGLAEEAVGEGDVAPGFTLPGTGGEAVSLDELRARGPVILSFYRGRW